MRYLAAVSLIIIWTTTVQGRQHPPKPVVDKPFQVESHGVARSIDDLWSRSTIVVEGTIDWSQPADYHDGMGLRVYTLYCVQIQNVYKRSPLVDSSTTALQVRRRGGARDVGDRIEQTRPADYPLFSVGERYILFLQQHEWPAGSPHEGVYYTETTFGPDSVFRIEANQLRTSSDTPVAENIRAGGVQPLRDWLRAMTTERSR